MIITAIAAKKRDTTFDVALAPPSPRNEMIRPANENISHTIIMFTTNENRVIGIPNMSLSIINVVSDAGPAIRGVPIGTLPTDG